MSIIASLVLGTLENNQDLDLSNELQREILAAAVATRLDEAIAEAEQMQAETKMQGLYPPSRWSNKTLMERAKDSFKKNS